MENCNPDAKYGRSSTVTLHDKESFKDCIMAKLKYSRELNFQAAVRVCIPFGKRNGVDIDEAQQKFYAHLFDEIATAETLGFIKVEWKKDELRTGKRKLKSITLTEKGQQWFLENDFKL